jgi:hypothetical protein
MVWSALLVLPEASFAVHVMVVVPSGYAAFNGSPSSRVPLTVTPEQLSVAVAVPGLTATSHDVVEDEDALAVMLAGGVTVGS